MDLATEGYDIVCVARSRRDGSAKLPGSVDETAELVRETGRQAWAEGVDVRDEEAIAKLAGRIEHEFGRCGLLLNNAAGAAPHPAPADSSKRWRRASAASSL